jgi:hypothetical protein
MSIESVYKNHIDHAIQCADRYSSKCRRDLLDIEGMSGKKTRHCYNNICSLSGARYLEIGTWRGSTLCSAICDNNIECVAIDNWSYSQDDRSIFFRNLERYRGVNTVKVIEGDCWNVSPSDIGMKFNIYMYDGDHTSESHSKALTHFLDCMEDVFIYIVDDWNDKRVRDGTLQGIDYANLNTCYRREVFTSDDNSHAKKHGKDSYWHNGVCFFVLKKT